ncbi:MAG TPA: hypothetical protein DEP71_04685 [Porphyromonadaceae bacterium]|jgi:hypothetical protein|nr:hypothetical protein [Porphyromonadaceae bacterium]
MMMKKIIKISVILPLLSFIFVTCTKEFDPTISSRNEMIKFSVLAENSGVYTDPENPDLQYPNFYKEAKGTIQDNKIIVFAPYYAKTWKGLKPTFVKSDRAIVYIGNEIQESGASEVDFTNSVEYKVVSEGGNEKIYSVEFYKEKPIINYSILVEDNPILPYDANIEIDSLNREISAIFRKGASVTGLKARFAVPEDVTVAVNGKPQISGESVLDFSNPIKYTLSLSDDYPEVWTVTPSFREPSSEANFLTFNFSKAKNPELMGDLVGEIDSVNQTIRVASYWTAEMNVVELIPDFTTSKYIKNVICNGVEQTSGESIVDFAKTVTYTITADDGSTQNWNVTFYKPTKFYIKDRHFRQLLNNKFPEILENDSLIIGKVISNPLPNGTEWWGDGLRNPDLPIQDFSGIEYFQAIPTLGIPGAQLGSNVLDLRKNIGLKWIVYWFADVQEIDVSGLPGDNGKVRIQITAGKTITRLRARDVKEISIEDSNVELEYLDYRGTKVNNFNNTGKVTFSKAGAKLLMTKSRWETWVVTNNPCVGVVQNSSNLTLELWSDDGKVLLETTVFR